MHTKRLKWEVFKLFLRVVTENYNLLGEKHQLLGILRLPAPMCPSLVSGILCCNLVTGALANTIHLQTVPEPERFLVLDVIVKDRASVVTWSFCSAPMFTPVTPLPQSV